MSENPGYSSYGEPAEVNNSTLAIIALVAGILGVTLFPLIGSIIAVIAGPMAKREIAESGGTLDGESLAQIGMILGWIGLGLSLCGCCVAIGIFGSSIFSILFALGVGEFGSIIPLLLLAF
jgi:hypothetical protein